MQLKIQRSQRNGLTGKVLFCVDIRADYSPDERANINRYVLGGQVIYNSQNARRHLENAGAHLERTQVGGVGQRASGLARGALSLALARMSLNISIASLARGHHIECKDLGEMLEAEDTVRTACKDLTRYLDAAATFNGSETVVEFINGEEREHIMQSAPPLLEYTSDKAKGAEGALIQSGEFAYETDEAKSTKGASADLKRSWFAFEQNVIDIARDFGVKLNPEMVRIFVGVFGLIIFLLFVKTI
ncbi:MAG TPA: hypothetical protein VIM56_05615 [Rhizomicrobium sp.]